MKYKSIKINNFRKFKNISFNFGKKITVISGINGIGKSSLLSLISSTTGTKDKKINGTSFQPVFSDFFKISKNEIYKNYRLYIDFDTQIYSSYGYYYNLTERLSMKNDTNYKRGIRLIPRINTPINNPHGMTLKTAMDEAKNQLNETASSRVHIPTIYLSLTRLIPMGEANIEVEKIENGKSPYKEIFDFYTKCYNSVLPNSIDNNEYAYFIKKSHSENNKNQKYLMLPIKDTTAETISVGQDSLSSIISSLTDFYALKRQNKDYKGGILCIDELDSSLHPSAIIALLELLNQKSEELDLQILVTTHSLTLLNKIICLQNTDPSNYQLIYLMDKNAPYVLNNPEFEQLKANMFDLTSFNEPELKVYGEDEVTRKLFKLLLNCAVSLGYIKADEIKNLSYIHVELGKDNLISLSKKDKYFRKVMIILDGDAKLKNPVKEQDNERAMRNMNQKAKFTERTDIPKTILTLPGFAAPEAFMYYILSIYTKDPAKHFEFWRSFQNTDSKLITSDKAIEHFKISDDTHFTDIYKKNNSWANKALKFFKDSNILTDYFKNIDNDSITVFAKDFQKTKKEVLKSVKAQIFE